MRKQTKSFWIRAVILLSLLALIIWFGGRSKAGEPEENPWRMCVHFTLTDEKKCADFEYPSKDSCERAKRWFVAQASWHKKNIYTCKHLTEISD